MKIIVTGGCGFIGTHLVYKLLELGHEIVVIDDLSSGSYCKTNVIKHKHAEYCLGSICGDVAWMFEDVGCVFHLAAEARIQASIDNPRHAINTNVCGTMSILEACRIHKVPRFVNSSSSAIYGLTDQFPTCEDAETDCLNPYSASKLAAEELIHCYAKTYGLEAFNLRYFNVFGENSPVVGPYSLVVGLFLDQLQNDQPLTVVGDGSSLRDFVHVSDVVNANIKAMTVKPEAPSQVINIGSGRNISVLEIAQTISNNITFVDPRPGEAKQTLANITRAKRVLGWEPRMFIQDWLVSQLLA